MKIDWKRKLTSRKFWSLLAALAVAVLQGIVVEDVVVRVTAIIMAVGACVGYMFSEASVDKAWAGYEPKDDGDDQPEG